MKAIALRLHPQQDLKVELDGFVRQRQIEAACILTGVGSLTTAHLRFASQPEGTLLKGPFEILSLSGLLSRHGLHCHIAIANSEGHTLGGHLLEGCLIYTTAEVVLGILPGLCFQREYDTATGYRELQVIPEEDSPGTYLSCL